MGIPQETRITSVPAHEAATWRSGRPDYEEEWPECEGVCIRGNCALRLDHPACCFVHPESETEEHMRPYADKATDMVVHTSDGCWRAKNFYCWR